MDGPEAKARDELAERLHRAHEQFHTSKLEWEKCLAASEDRHDERVKAAWQKLQEAEREVEEAEASIKKAMDAG